VLHLRKGLPKGSKNRIALPVSGDDANSKQLVMALLDKMGSDAIDAGRSPNPGATSLGRLRTALIQRFNSCHYCYSEPNETKQ
jgi:predicted dinucleotide-binding enzyme